MALTPKAVGDAKGYAIPYWAMVSSVNDSPALPSGDFTISLWYNDQGTSDRDHVHIQRASGTITLTVNNDTQSVYGGTVGSTYGDLIKNVLTDQFGEYTSGWGAVHCVEQLIAPAVFIEGQGDRCKPLEAVNIPSTYEADTSGTIFTGGNATPNLFSAYGMYSDRVFTGSNAYDSSNTWNRGAISEGYAEYDLGTGNERGLWEYRLQADTTHAGMYTPSSVRVEASNDGSNWDILDSFNPSQWSVSQWTTRTPMSTPPYRYYRLYASGHMGGDEFMIGRWVAYAPKLKTYGDSGSHLDFSNPDHLGFDSAQTAVPQPDANILTGGTAAATHSQEPGVWTPAKCLDGSYGTGVNGWYSTLSNGPGIWYYDLPSPKVPKKCSVVAVWDYPGWWPYQMDIVGWNGTSWDVLYEHRESARNGTQDAWIDFEFPDNTTAYSRVGVRPMACVENNRIGLAEIRFYEPVADDSPNSWDITGTQATEL